MGEMVERVARAIEEKNQSLTTSELSKKWELFSRVAIEAMMEPTEDMANAAECAEPFSFEEMWMAAIHVALSEK